MAWRKTLQIFIPITSKNSASGGGAGGRGRHEYSKGLRQWCLGSSILWSRGAKYLRIPLLLGLFYLILVLSM
jgi:hypothetical protein